MRGALIIIIVIILVASYKAYDMYYGGKGGKDVAVLQVIEHPALNSTRQGIMDYLKHCCDLSLGYENAHGNPALSVQIAQKLIQKKPKVIVAIGTLAAQSLLKYKKIPVVFSSITDPVRAGLLSDTNFPNMNFTGVSNMIDISSQLKLMKQVKPSIKTVGIIYNAGEVNSITLVEHIKEIAVAADIVIKESVASSSGEAILAVQKLVEDVDAIFITNDNTALSALAGIVKVATANRIPVFCSDTDTIHNGVVAVLGPNQYDIGVATGKIVEQLLNGTSISKIPVQFPQKIELMINLAAANKIGLSIGEDIIKSAYKVVQ